MEVTLPADLDKQVQHAIRSGKYDSSHQLIEAAVRFLLEESERTERISSAMKSLADSVDAAGLYDQTYIPSAR